ncbi:hypothetical protein BDF22DRAFT_141034 [Syncephalis plumigaleata]|nr:hypothetical protein BDF22DRAFT_141034 [Syncephalis plumigaleata]
MTTTDRSHTRATATGATADTHGMTRSSMPVTATGATAAHGQSEQQWRDARYMQTQSGYRPGTRHEMIEPEMHASVEMTAASTRKPYDHAMLSSNNLAAATAASVYNDAYYTGDDHLPTGAYSKRRASSAYTTMNPHGDNVGAGITLHTAGKSASSNYDHIAESHHEARTEISEDDAANILCSLTQLPATALAINNEPIESPEELV